MFRDVPECSGMFHAPGFIDAPHLGAITRKTTAFILLFGISHLRFYGLAALAIFYVPDLFGVCHLLLVLWAYSYLCRFISTIPRVAQIGQSICFRWFFLVCCFIRLEKCAVITAYDFRSSAPAISPVNLGRLDWTGLDWTGLDWTSKTRTCKTRTQDRLLRTSFFFRFFLRL